MTSMLTTSTADNKWVFNLTTYLSKYASGDLAKIPKMVGTTAREWSALAPYPVHNKTAGPSEALIYQHTLATVCAAYNTSVYREDVGLTTYRYQWAGNFSNIDANIDWLGAYHYSDLYMFFGTYLIAPGYIPPLEVQSSEVMQDLMYDFINDPNSLPSNGWPAYDTMAANGGQMLRFGADGQAVQVVSGNDVDGACHIPGDVYNTTP